jgi:hypothetical protein
MNSVQKLFRSYVDKIYDGELPSQQEIELSRAFYSGMLGSITAMMAISARDEDEEIGARRIEKMRGEILAAMKATLNVQRQ